jgi:hypothetical protein
MNTKKRFAMYVTVLSGLLVALLALVALAGCEDDPIVGGPLPGPLAAKAGEKTKVFVVAPSPLPPLTEVPSRIRYISLSPDEDGNKVQIRQAPKYEYETHDPAVEPVYQVLKNFLQSAGVKGPHDENLNGDSISFDENGKIHYFTKYDTTADMELVFGAGPGELDPALFASEVTLAGNDEKSITVSGDDLADGTVLTLFGGKSAITYVIYGTTYTTTPPDNIKYTYPDGVNYEEE